MDRRPAIQRRRSARTLAVAVSALVHGLALVAIVTTPTPKTDLPVARPIEMELVAPPRPARRPNKVAPASTSRGAAVSMASATSAVLPSVAKMAAPSANPLPESQTPSGTGADVVAGALRGSVGCDHAGLFALTEEERRHCRERIATGRATEAQYADLGIDPEKRAVFDAAWTADHAPRHMPGFACLAKFGGGKIQWAHPSEGIKVPRLPCYFFTPKATFSVDPPHKSAW